MKNQYFGDENDYKKYGLINNNRVVFFLLPLEAHLAAFERHIPQVEHAWAGQIEVRRHACP
jgi:hypothetical protein